MALPQDIEDPQFEVVKIGPCCYRKLVVPENLNFKGGDVYDDWDEDEEGPRELDDQMVFEGDEWTLKIPVPAVFHKFIIGTRGQMKSRLELESGAQIRIPNREDQEDVVYLRARQKNQLYSAKAQIELLCEREEPKLEYTHFLSIPLSYDTKFRQQVDRFREDVVLQRFPGIDASIFMPARRMHFTVCMLKLHSHAQISEMKEVLIGLSKRIAETRDFARGLAAHLAGLHIMNDDPTSTGLIFTTDRSHALQHSMNNIADMIFETLQARNLASFQNLMSQRLLSSDGKHAEVKLHATLMNTKYSKTERSRGDRETFDASALMERFSQVDFGTVQLRELQLSCLDEMGDDGYYRSLHKVPLCGPRAVG